MGRAAGRQQAWGLALRLLAATGVSIHMLQPEVAAHDCLQVLARSVATVLAHSPLVPLQTQPHDGLRDCAAWTGGRKRPAGAAPCRAAAPAASALLPTRKIHRSVPCPRLPNFLLLPACRQDVTQQKARPWIWRDKLQSRWRYLQVWGGVAVVLAAGDTGREPLQPQVNRCIQALQHHVQLRWPLPAPPRRCCATWAPPRTCSGTSFP